MNRGKEKCELLKSIRLLVADKYGLDYKPSECTHQGDCSGTCPKCDAELKDLQRQLEECGIKDIDLADIKIDELYIDEPKTDVQGNIIFPSYKDFIRHTIGMPGEPYVYKEKRRVLYKECQIAGITFHDLHDIWEELYEGAELVLVRDKANKYDNYAIAVALADDYDPDNFDDILGYVPRTENKHLATMLDLGWADAFECELSQVNGDNPYKGSLYMKIYMVSREEEEIDDTRNLLRVLELDEGGYRDLTSSLSTQGCSCFRWGGFPPWEHKLPKKGEMVVFMYKEEQSTVLYLMHCMAVGDDDASYFVADKDSLFAVDDCCYYVFTNSKGPVRINNTDLSFLGSENINKGQPERFLSEVASFRLIYMLDKY